MAHSTDGDQYWLVRDLNGSLFRVRLAMPCRPAPNVSAYEQIEDARHDDDPDGACGDAAACVPRFFTERGGGLEAGERGDAVDHRIRDIGELAVRRRCR